MKHKLKIFLTLILLSVTQSKAIVTDLVFTGETNTVKFSKNLVYAVTTNFAPGYGYFLRTKIFRGRNRGFIKIYQGEVTDPDGNILGRCTFDTNNECILDNSLPFFNPYRYPQNYTLGNITLVAEFVDRFYKKILNRPSDSEGLLDWVMQLRLKEKTAADIAKGFIFSQEFTDKNVTNIEYVNTLYAAFFDRPADTAGLNGWLGALEEGKSKEEILDGFLGSAEFGDLAARSDIEATSLIRSTDSSLSDIEQFVARFYEKILDRTPDRVGLDSWATQLQNGEKTASDIAKGFIFSSEFASRDIIPERHPVKFITSGTEDFYFVKLLYNAFFDRDKSNQEKYWYERLRSGTTREEVVNGFLGSPEFANLATRYGIRVN